MSNGCDYYFQQNGNGGREVERERRRHGRECMHARRICVCACNHTHAKSSKGCKKRLAERLKMMMMVYCVCNLCELCMPWHACVFVCKRYLDQIYALLKIQTKFTNTNTL